MSRPPDRPGVLHPARARCVPSTRLAWGFAVASLPLLAAAATPDAMVIAWLLDGLLVAGWIVSARGMRRVDWRVRREGGGRGQCGVAGTWRVFLDNPGDTPLSFRLAQEGNDDWTVAPADARRTVDVAAGESVALSLAATPRRRGTHPPPPLEATVTRPGGWTVAWGTVEDDTPRVVYPTLTALRQYDRLRRAGALGRIGVRRRRVVGTGREFERLREYQPDDSYRDINWKATARRDRPIVNVHQVEKSQDVFLAVETGRMMGRPVGGGTLLDAAVDSSLALAHAAIREGDRVGLASYADRLESYRAPRAGAVALRQVTDALAGLTSTGAFPSPLALAEALRTRQRKRSLVFIYTDFGDPQLADDLAEALRPVARRHVVVVLGVRDGALSRMAGRPPANAEGLFETFAARRLEEEREAGVVALRQWGVDVVEVEDAGRLALLAVNRYLAIKARQQV